MINSYNKTLVILLTVLLSATAEAATYTDFVASLPWQRLASNPSISAPQPGSYTNLNPSSWIIDPLDNSKFLLYIGEFKTPAGAGKVSLFTGSLNDLTSLVLYGDVLTPAMFSGNGIVYGNAVVSGETVYYIFTPDPFGAIYIASSTDGGRTFTINPTPLLSPDTGAGEGGFETPFTTNYGGATWYMYFTVRGPAPNYTFLYQEVATASSPTGPWTRQNIDILPNGTGGDFALGIEGAQFHKIGSDYVAIYNGFTGVVFAIGLAHSTGPLTPFIADNSINPVLAGSGGDTNWDSYGCVGPALLQNGHQTSLYFGGYKSDAFTTNIVNIGLATLFSDIRVANLGTLNRLSNPGRGGKIGNPK